MRIARGRQIFFYLYSIQFHQRPLQFFFAVLGYDSLIVLIGNPDKFHQPNGAGSRLQL